MELNLTDKSVLITGSSRGLGRATAEVFLREGARVCLCARGVEDLLATQRALEVRGTVVVVAADVTTPLGAEQAVARTIEAFGRIDILVNNVGGSRGAGSFDQVTPAQWREVLDVNVMAAVYCSQVAVTWMKGHGGGCIVNIGSIFGREYASSSPYTAAKAAITALTKEMAVDLARYGIRVNSVAPGSLLFPGGSWDRRQKQDPERVARMVENELPWRRFGRPEEVAEAIAFLCSERASWISGACLPVDGAQGRAF